MKNYIVVATVCAALVACKGEAGDDKAEQAAAPETVSLQTEIQKASYSIGMRFGEGMGRDLSDLDIGAFYAGFEDGFSGKEPKMTPEEMVATMQALQAKKMEEQQEEFLEQQDSSRKILERKLQEAHNETEEQRRLLTNLKRKTQRHNQDMSDVKLHLEEQVTRNSELEKKQRR